MLDRTDFESWQQRIRLYRLGKDNGVNILKSIDEGPFKMGKFRETLAEGALHLGPERDRFFADLTPEEKERFKADIRATNILLQGLPKDIYTLISHYTDAKDIWDNVKMLLEDSELTKDERESQLYDEFEHFRQNKGETIHEYYLNSKFVNNMLPEWGRFVLAVKLNRGLKQSNYDQLYAYLKQHEAHANENKMMLERFNQHALDPLALGRQNRGQGNYARGAVAAGNEGVQNRVGNANHAQDLALNEDNIFQADQCDAFDSDVDEAPTTQTMFMANLSSVDPIYDEAMQAKQSNVSSVPNDALMMIINDMHEQTAQCVSANEQNKVVNESLTAKLARYKEQVELYEKGQGIRLSLPKATMKQLSGSFRYPSDNHKLDHRLSTSRQIHKGITKRAVRISSLATWNEEYDSKNSRTSLVGRMAEENVPAPAPTRSDEQILPFKAWIHNTNFFRAFTASANVPTIYIQQFWNTLTQEAKSRVYSFQLDEQWFTLNDDLLHKALEITPVDSAHPIVSPPAGEQVMDFVNELGYPEEIHFVSKMHVNNVYQPWRAILSLINQCLTGKTSEFVQAIKIFFAYRANLNIPTKKRLASPIHVTGDDFPFGNLKFVPKGKKDEVFGKTIPNELITEAIRNSSYYQQYLEMVARKPTAKVGGQKKTSSKADKPTPVMKPASAKQTKPVKEKSTKPAPSKKANNGKVLKVRKAKSSLQLVDEEDEETQPAHEPQIEDDEYNLQRGIQMSLEPFQAPVDGVVVREPASGVTRSLPVVEGKGKAIATNEQTLVTEEASTGPSAEPHDDTSANVVRDKEKSNSEDEDQAGSNPGQGHVALAGPNPEPMHEVFVATVCPQVHESLKHTDKEHVHIENPLSSFGTLSSMKNLDDAFTYGDQFLNDKPTEEEPDKANVETEVESMVCANFEKRHKAQDKTVQALSSKVFTLENHDLYSKIDKHINEVIKEAVHNAYQAPIHERFRDLSEFEMKEILRDRMFESGSYKSHPEHITLYEALEASMDHENKEEFNAEMAKSHKRRRDDQDPPPHPSKDSDQNKKKRHDSDTSASKQSQAQTSSTWKTSNIREAPSGSSKQKPDP
ncbi:hypothetical protein Tco_0201721 [Tanacetum coccineum]